MRACNERDSTAEMAEDVAIRKLAVRVAVPHFSFPDSETSRAGVPRTIESRDGKMLIKIEVDSVCLVMKSRSHENAN